MTDYVSSKEKKNSGTEAATTMIATILKPVCSPEIETNKYLCLTSCSLHGHL